MSGLWASRYGTAPMWSSCPWVSTIAWTSSSRSRIGGEVGQDQVDARLFDVGEEHPAVDDQQLAVVLEDRHVPPDGAEAAERDDAQGALGQRRGRFHLEVRLTHAATPLRATLSRPATCHSSVPRSGARSSPPLLVGAEGQTRRGGVLAQLVHFRLGGVDQR